MRCGARRTLMRIGINALYMIPGGVGGTEIYLRSLLLALHRLNSPHEFVVFVNTETSTGLALPSSQFRVVRTGVHATNRPARLLWEQFAFPGRLGQERIDVLLNPGFTAPVMPPCPSVTVFHDLQHTRHPEYFRWFDLPFWQLFLYASAHRSSRIIAVSEATRQDFLAHYKLDASRVRVVHHGVDVEFFGIRERRAQAANGERYVLTVSTLHPHKNFRRLLVAFSEFIKRRPDIKLIIAGLRGFDAANIGDLIRELQLGDRVRCTGWIPRDELYNLFAGADAFIYPTTFEGFGMTLLEGLASGLPVACSAIEPVKTLAGNATLLFDPHKTEEIGAALVRITEDEVLRNALRVAGPERARQFTWEETARLTLETLTEAATPRVR
jgi:glycosyltransferase involved in cell wall biosynthesis